MANLNESPYVCHVFVCTNDRGGKSKSCADQDSPSIRTHLKKEISKRGFKKQVRVSISGCMGLCGKGPNVMIYPQNIWFSGVSTEDTGEILSKIEELLSESP